MLSDVAMLISRRSAAYYAAMFICHYRFFFRFAEDAAPYKSAPAAILRAPYRFERRHDTDYRRHVTISRR